MRLTDFLRAFASAAIVVPLTLFAPGCGCSEEMPGDGGVDTDGSTDTDGGGDMDAATGMDAGTGTDGGDAGDGADAGTLADGEIFVPDGGMLPPDGAVMLDGGGLCYVATCRGVVWGCGDCTDNDMDGLIDSEDPDCIGACDNNEAGFELMIPGTETPNCNLDCYYEANQGAGTDDCRWNSRCDPLEPEAPECTYLAPEDRPGGIRCPDVQSDECHMNCDPITPNGCDCFGCCEVPGADTPIYLGSDPVGAVDCTASTPDGCRACTQVEDCLNECERCEVCFGESVEDLDCDCFDTGSLPARCIPDAGPVPDGGRDAGPPPPDAGTSPDAGPPSMRCPGGEQPCGLPTDPACPEFEFCLTGCCAFFG